MQHFKKQSLACVSFLLVAISAAATINWLAAPVRAELGDDDPPGTIDQAPPVAPIPSGPVVSKDSARTLGAGAFATKFDDTPNVDPTTISSGAFDGIQPGKTTTNDLIHHWGEGKLAPGESGESVRVYTPTLFPRIEVTLASDVVKSITVHLSKPTAAESLVKQFQVAEFRPVNIPDESGEPLGQAYPERGVLFTFAQGGNLVSHVSIEKVDINSFLLRAEFNLENQPRRSLADLEYVLAQEPQNAQALWLRSKIYLKLARYDDAFAACEAAIAADANQPEYRLTRGEILGRLGKYDEGAHQTKEVLDTASLSQELKCKAFCQLGNLIAQSPAHDYQLAMDQHQAAINIADPLSVDKHASIRRMAKGVLVEAHVAMANDIACGNFQQKERTVGKWLDRAGAYADEFVDKDGGDSVERLHFARGGLAVCAAMQGKMDSVPFARLALIQGKRLIAAADDIWHKRELEWELGMALADGLVSDEARGMTKHSLANSALTVSYLEDGAKGRAENPEDVFHLGWMYYRVGALHAIGENDHKTALTWYEKALPLLDRPIPKTLHAQQGHYGEWLVSMGITYWEIGQREVALELTDAGMQHVEEAVKQKLIEPKALGVPYNNLANMHKAMGDTAEAKNFAEMAAKFDSSATTPSIKR